MTKITKLGLSAMVAFALMFTTSFNVVAQEKAGNPTDKTEAGFAQGDKVAGEAQVAFSTTTYYYTGPDNFSDGDIETPGNWKEMQDDFTCSPGNQIPCSLEVPEDKTIAEHLQDLGDASDILADAELGRQAVTPQ